MFFIHGVIIAKYLLHLHQHNSAISSRVTSAGIRSRSVTPTATSTMDDFTVKGRADMITESETRFHKPVNRTEDRSSKNTLAFGLIAQCSFYIHALRTLVIL